MKVQIGQAYEARMTKGASSKRRGRHVVVISRIRIPEIGIRYVVKRVDNGEEFEVKGSELRAVTPSAIRDWEEFR
jgi:hypothetical protein